MLKRVFKKIDNRAFTLVEIVLAVALLAIASISIGSMIISTQNNTAKMLSESELQQQLVEVQQAFHNEVVATNAGIKYWTKIGNSTSFIEAFEDYGGETEKLIGFYHIDSVDADNGVEDWTLTKTYYYWKASDKTMKVGSFEIDWPTGIGKTFDIDVNINEDLQNISNWTLLATNIKKINIDFTNLKNNGLISYSIEVEQGDISYKTDDTVRTRNDIGVNQNIDANAYHVKQIKKPTLIGEFEYDGTTHSPTESGFLDAYMTKVEDGRATRSAVDVGNYVIIYALKDPVNTQWEDGSTGEVRLKWKIEPKGVTLQWGTTRWVYNGEEHSTTCVVASGVVPGDVCEVSLINNKVGPEVGTQVCQASLNNSNYKLPLISSVVLRVDSTTDHVHTEAFNEGKDPTCTESGLTDGSYCSTCNQSIQKQEVIPSLGHIDDNDDGLCDRCGTASC